MEVGFERKNYIKTRFYQVFYKLVEPTVIDMVLEGCGYEENETYKKLSDMCNHKAPPLNNAPENPAQSAYDPAADNQRSPPSYSHLYHNIHQQAQSAHDPAADNQRSPPPYSHLFHDIHQQVHSACESNETGLPPPMSVNVADRTRFFEQFQQAGRQPSAPIISSPIQAPVMSLPPPYQINPTPYVPKDLYSLPPPADKSPRGLGRIVNGNNESDFGIKNANMELFMKLQLLRRIAETVKERSKAHRAEEKVKKDLKRQEPSNLSIRGFPEHWSRSDRGVTIIPVKGDRRIEIANVVKNMRLKDLIVEIQAIEELCNFNIYEQFLVEKHCIEEQKKPLNEKQLWYYARMKDVEDICYQGINFKHDLSTGSIGVGKYFFSTPELAHKARSKNLHKDDIAYMFLCDVNVGRMVKGHSENDFIPIDEKGSPYESSVDNIMNPTVFILHDKNNCYPRFMITYKVKPVNQQ